MRFQIDEKHFDLLSVDLPPKEYQVITEPYHINVREKWFNHFMGNYSPGMSEDTVGFIDMVGDDIKVIVGMSDNFFHFLTDTLGAILEFLATADKELLSKSRFVIDACNPSFKNNKFHQMLRHVLESHGAKFVFLQGRTLQGINAKNFILLNQCLISRSAVFWYREMESFIGHVTENPFRKAFLSRRSDKVKNSDDRIDDEEALEQYFSDLGFEIVYAEQFQTMKDQAKYFSEVSTLASLTGAGLTNMIFMKPGQTVIEVVSPLLLGDEGGFHKYEMHHFYKSLSMAKNHTLICVSNLSKMWHNTSTNLDRAKHLLSTLHLF
jgi:hypothetical protein